MGKVMNILKKTGIGFLVLLFIAVLLITYRMISEGAASRAMSFESGGSTGRFPACPESPNCVSSYATGDIHSVDPIDGDAAVLAKIARYLKAQKTARIIEQTPNYLYATCQSRLFGFVDDLELYFDGFVIQVRSASRVGYSDLGANRKRVEKLRALAGQP